MEIGKRIQSLRKKMGYTQKALSEKSGVPLITIQQYERGVRKTPNIENLMRIAAALNTSMHYLLGITDDQNDPRFSEWVEHEGVSLKKLRKKEIKEDELRGDIKKAIEKLTVSTMEICSEDGGEDEHIPARVDIVTDLIIDNKQHLKDRFKEMENQMRSDTTEK